MFQTLQLIDGVLLPVEDTLNIKNGMNYAQFLEAILRIAYIKSEENGAPFKTTLDRIFQNANIDIGKRQEVDSFLNQFYSEENIEECIQAEDLLCAIFCTKASNRNNTYLELEKQSLVQILKDAGIIKVPVLKKAESKTEGSKKGKNPAPAEKSKEEAAPKETNEEQVTFTEMDCLAAIAEVESFDNQMLGYFEYLECLMRIAVKYKSNAEWEAIHTSATQRLFWLIGELEKKFAVLIGPFAQEREQLEKQKVYQPRAVVDDDQNDESDDEDD